MNTFNNIISNGYNIKDVTILKKNYFVLSLENGLKIVVPFSKFEKLKLASNLQLQNWRIISSGLGISWDELDEDISIAGILDELKDEIAQLKSETCNTCNNSSAILEYA